MLNEASGGPVSYAEIESFPPRKVKRTDRREREREREREGGQFGKSVNRLSVRPFVATLMESFAASLSPAEPEGRSRPSASEGGALIVREASVRRSPAESPSASGNLGCERK